MGGGAVVPHILYRAEAFLRGGPGAIQYQPGIRWQQTLKQRQNIRLLLVAAALHGQTCCWDSEEGPVETGLFTPAAPVAGLEMSQNSFWSSTNSDDVRISATLKVTRASPDLPHAPEQRSRKTSYILTSASERGCKTPATGAARPASQSISTSPASCPTLCPPLLLLITGALVRRAALRRSGERRQRGDGGIAPPVMVPQLRVRLTAALHGGGRRQTAAHHAYSSREAGRLHAPTKAKTGVRVSAKRGTISIVAGRDKRDVKGQAGTSRFLRRGLLLLRAFKGTARRARRRGCAPASASVKRKFCRTHAHRR